MLRRWCILGLWIIELQLGLIRMTTEAHFYVAAIIDAELAASVGHGEGMPSARLKTA